MVKLHMETALPQASAGSLRPRRVRVAFSASSRKAVREARWHLEGLSLAVLVSLLLWGVVAAAVIR